MMMEQNPFRRALDGWSEEAWLKGSLYDSMIDAKTGAVITLGWCAVGRLNEVIGLTEMNAWPMLGNTFANMYPDRIGYADDAWDDELWSPDELIPQINDHIETTFEDVTAAFEKAAVKWDEQI